jgi:hypothetical protein
VQIRKPLRRHDIFLKSHEDVSKRIRKALSIFIDGKNIIYPRKLLRCHIQPKQSHRNLSLRQIFIFVIRRSILKAVKNIESHWQL